jgi:hypothetical protein
MRKFNVFSELVVPYPGEVFEWVVFANEITPGNTVTVSSTAWPLTAPSYPVQPGHPVAATVANTPGAQGTFACSPPANNVTTQTIVVASQPPISICNNVNVIPGDYFIWENTNTKPVLIKPDEANTNFWPLPSQEHVVPANGYTAVLIPTDATENSYSLVITMEGAAVCPDNAQPKIIIGSGK